MSFAAISSNNRSNEASSLYTEREVAELFHIRIIDLRAAVKRGTIPPADIMVSLRKRYWRRSTIGALLNGKVVTSA